MRANSTPTMRSRKRSGWRARDPSLRWAHSEVLARDVMRGSMAPATRSRMNTQVETQGPSSVAGEAQDVC